MKKINFFSLIIPGVMATDKWTDETGKEPARLEDIAVIATRILNIAIRLAGIAVFVMLIVGGFQYLTAGGDPKKTQAASSTLTFAIIGLVIILLAWFVMVFIEKFTGVRITELPESFFGEFGNLFHE